MDLPSLRLVGEVGARVDARSSYTRWGPTITRIGTQVLTVARLALLTGELPHYPVF